MTLQQLSKPSHLTFLQTALVLILLICPARLQAATAAWIQNPEPDVAGYRLSYGTQPGVHPTVIDVGNVTTFAFNPPGGFTYYVVVHAYNSYGAPGPDSTEVSIFIQGTNTAPTLAQPPNQTGAENTTVSLALVGSDAQGTALTYSGTGLPPGLAVNSGTGLIAGTLTFASAGSYTVTATVSDGSLTASRTFTWTVTNTNQAPSLASPSNQTSAQNTSVSLALVASDPDGTALSYSATGLPAGLSINATSGLITGTVTTAATSNVSAAASDGALSASVAFTWTVTTAGGTTITVNLPATDTSISVEGGNGSTSNNLQAFTYPANRVGMAIVMKFDVSQIPANATVQTAVLNLSLIAVDAFTAEPSYSVSLHGIINRNPVITQATGSLAATATPWTANTCCTNGMPMAQSDISAVRSVAAVNRTLGFKTWDALSTVQAWRTSPATNYGLLLNSDVTKGQNRFRTFASNDHATVAQRPFLQVTYVLPAVDTTAPSVSVSSPAAGAIVSGTAVTVSAAASDAVGVVGVRMRLDGVNLGNEDTAAPFSIVWDTTTVANGSHALTAVARDAAGNTATSATVMVTVNNAVPNRAPTMTQPSNQSSAEGGTVSFALVASDPDGNPLTYSATGLPTGLAINATSGLISGVPTFTSAGAYTVSATASDGLLSITRTFSWTITNTNRAPVLAQPLDQSSIMNTAASLALSASDPDGTAVTYNVTGLPLGLTVNVTTGLISGTLGNESGGVYAVTATASDGSLTASRTFVWGVNNSDLGVSGDFDGDGRGDPATYRASTGEWSIWPSAGNYAAAAPIVWGSGEDVPVAADYDGDQRTDIAVYRPATGSWHVLLSSTNMQTSLEVQWGDNLDRPVPIDYDGDGRADLALVRFGGYEILLSSTNYSTSVTVR